MALPPEFLDELKARIGLADLIGRRVQLRLHGREHKGLCPFHEEKSPSFTVNEQKGFFHCFGCGAHGSIFDFVMRSQGVEFIEAVRILAADAGLAMPASDPGARARQDRRARLIAVLDEAARWYRSQLAGRGGQDARAYLDRRGVMPESREAFGLGLAPKRNDGVLGAMTARGHDVELLIEAGLIARAEDRGELYDRFRDRLMFPIQDSAGRTVGFGGRALGEARAKYLNSPETPVFHKGNVLYNLPMAREAARRAGGVLVVEGYMDVIALAQAGFRHAVAPLGTAVTEAQLGLLWKIAPEPVLCFDGDAAGQRAAQRLSERALPLLRPGHSLRFVALPEGLDPADLIGAEGPSAMQQAIERAVPMIEAIWRGAIAGEDLSTPERRAGLQQSLRRLCATIHDDGVRRHYLDMLNARIEQMFARTGDARSGAGAARRGDRPWRPRDRFERLQGLDRRLPGARKGSPTARERALIAIPLLFPVLIEELVEDLVALSLTSSELDRVRAAILETAASGQPLDLGAIKATLNDSGAKALVDSLLDGAVRGTGALLRPLAGSAEAKGTWKRIFHMYQVDQAQQELSAATREFRAEQSERAQARLTAARALVEDLRRTTFDEADADLASGAPSSRDGMARRGAEVEPY